MAESNEIFALQEVSLVRAGRRILGDLNWRAEAGEHWAVIGPNGSGKTMLLRILSAQLWPSSGTVTLLGSRYGTCDLRQLRRCVGVVSMDLQYAFLQRQDPVLEVVVSGETGTIGLFEQKVSPEFVHAAQAALCLLDVEDLALRRFRELSYGEQKRVLIARALVTNPQLLVLDEACTGLDWRAREEFLELLQDLVARDKLPATVFVTHHCEELLPFISHCLFLKEGRCLAQGKKTEVLNAELLGKTLDIAVDLNLRAQRYWPTVKVS